MMNNGPVDERLVVLIDRLLGASNLGRLPEGIGYEDMIVTLGALVALLDDAEDEAASRPPSTYIPAENQLPAQLANTQYLITPTPELKKALADLQSIQLQQTIANLANSLRSAPTPPPVPVAAPPTPTPAAGQPARQRLTDDEVASGVQLLINGQRSSGRVAV